MMPTEDFLRANKLGILVHPRVIGAKFPGLVSARYELHFGKYISVEQLIDLANSRKNKDQRYQALYYFLVAVGDAIGKLVREEKNSLVHELAHV